MNKIITLTIFVGIASHALAQYNSQNLVTSAGDYFENNENIISWSLGEIATETFVGSSLIITQGFQQTQLTPNGINEPKTNNDLPFTIYPNPTTGEFFILINKNTNPLILPNSLEIYDIQGKKLFSEEILGNSKTINIKNYSEALYYLRLFNTNSNFSNTVLIYKLNP